MSTRTHMRANGMNKREASAVGILHLLGDDRFIIPPSGAQEAYDVAVTYLRSRTLDGSIPDRYKWLTNKAERRMAIVRKLYNM